MFQNFITALVWICCLSAFVNAYLALSHILPQTNVASLSFLFYIYGLACKKINIRVCFIIINYIYKHH